MALSPAPSSSVASCWVEGCSRPVSKSGHKLCYDHWKAERDGKLTSCTRCARPHTRPGPMCRVCYEGKHPAQIEDDLPAGLLSSTKIGELVGLSSVKINLILAELGWIERYVKGWTPTDQGNRLGANVRESRSGVPYVVWPPLIVHVSAFRASVTQQGGHPARDSAGTIVAAPAKPAAAPPPLPAKPDDFRERFPATHLAMDGHRVRSKAELLIDNWLYVQGIIHAYERRLPIEEECYCDFYLPRPRTGGGKDVYIEYWGLENDPKYRQRKEAKKSLYEKYGFRLIELTDAEVERLDDVLPRLLLRFGIESA